VVAAAALAAVQPRPFAISGDKSIPYGLDSYRFVAAVRILRQRLLGSFVRAELHRWGL